MAVFVNLSPQEFRGTPRKGGQLGRKVFKELLKGWVGTRGELSMNLLGGHGDRKSPGKRSGKSISGIFSIFSGLHGESLLC